MKSLEIEIAIIWRFSAWPEKAACGNLCSEEGECSSGQVFVLDSRTKSNAWLRRQENMLTLGEILFKNCFDIWFSFLLPKANFRRTTIKGYSTNCSFEIYFGICNKLASQRYFFWRKEWQGISMFICSLSNQIQFKKHDLLPWSYDDCITQTKISKIIVRLPIDLFSFWPCF